MKNLVTANQSHIEDAFEKINKVVRFLKRNDFNEFAVVGSSALLVCGFPLNRNVGDIDIEVICSHKREQVSRLLLMHTETTSMRHERNILKSQVLLTNLTSLRLPE